MHNISVTSKFVKKVITSLDLSKMFGPDCITILVLKKCKPELSYILAELFNMCLTNFIFQIIERPYLWSLYLRMLRTGLQLKLRPVSFLSVVSKIFEKNL